MKVINVHRRIIDQSLDKVSELIKTLSTRDDKIWPYENWPAIRFDNGLKVGSKGGHGIIRYTIVEYDPDHFIKFQFTKPVGFNGTHQFEMKAISDTTTEVIHIIAVITTGSATIFWTLAIRWLHDALIEDAFDKLESQFYRVEEPSKHSLWVRFLRYILKPRKKSSN